MRDTLILFTQTRDHGELIARINRMSRVTGYGTQFRYYSDADCVFGVDDSGDVLGDYDDEELAYVREMVGDSKATLFEYQSLSCARTFLEKVLPGLNGVVDTNYEAFVPYASVLEWLSRYPDRHFREGPPVMK